MRSQKAAIWSSSQEKDFKNEFNYIRFHCVCLLIFFEQIFDFVY